MTPDRSDPAREPLRDAPREPLRDPVRDPARSSARSEPTRRGLRRAWLVFFLVGALLAGAGFVYKLREFFFDLTNTEGFEFAGVHLVTYLLVAGGFLLLLVHGFLRGHYADIERPKYELLEHERALDAQEFRA